jgi:hypothetical protein
MLKRYMNHVQKKTPHHRRQHAAQVAGLITAVAFVVWITTLGVHYSTSANTIAGAENDDTQQTQLAGVDAAGDGSDGSVIEVVGATTTSDFSNYSDTSVTQ